MPLSDVLRANERFLGSGEELEPSSEPASRKAAIVTCIDGRLTGLVEEAMGFARGEALTIRVAGATMAENDEVVRSLAMGVYAVGVTEIYVVGHTDCAAARVDTFKFTEAMRAAGVSRDAVGLLSLRDWLGAFFDVRSGVERTIQKIRETGILPLNIPIYGLVIDTDTGALKVIEGADITAEANREI